MIFYKIWNKIKAIKNYLKNKYNETEAHLQV